MAERSSVVIVSLRPGEWLAPCVESALAQSDDVVVVDNGSAGADASQIARGLGARSVRLPWNLGFAAGADIGFRMAKGDVIGLLNDDASAEANWLDVARQVLDDPSVAAVTPKVVLAGRYAEVVLEDQPWFAPGDARPLGRMLRSVTVGGIELLPRLVGAGVHRLERGPADGEADAMWRWTTGALPFYVPLPASRRGQPVVVNGEPQPATPAVRVVNHAGSFLAPHGGAGEIGFGAPDDGRFDVPAERFGFSGTAPVFRRSALRRVGGFAVAYFAYNEDTDWCLRARMAGYRIMYTPAATVSHRWSATSGGPNEPRVVHLTRRNALLCLVRNAPVPAARHALSELSHGPSGDPVRRAVLARLPWAASSRLVLRRRRARPPEEVWEQWVGRDSTWDVSPARR